MNSARPIDEGKAGAPGQGATIVAGNIGAGYPSRVASVTAEVLARMLRGERLTGLATVTTSSTTRLAAIVDYLAGHYGWTIDREDLAAGCRDGRMAWVREYRMSPQTIAHAMSAGAEAWCVQVWEARQRLRMKAPEAREAATRANLRRRAGTRRRLGSQMEAEGVPA